MSRIHGTKQIIAGSLKDAAIAADAAIQDIKLGTIATAGKVNVSAITGVLSSANGGTGVDNGANTITIGGNLNLSSAFTTTGAFTTNLTQSANVTLALPSVNGTLATEEFVSALAQSLDPKASVRAATQAALPAVTYDNGAAGVGATLTADAVGALPAQDGVTMVAGDRLLVKNQAAALQNGIYVVTALGDASNPFILTRATDCDGSPANEVSGGMYTFVEAGTNSAGNGYVAIADGNITVGTGAINMSQFSGAGQITAGNGLVKSGNTIDIGPAYWDDIQQIDTWNVASVTGMVQADLQKLADLDVTAAELNELNGAGCVNADFVKLHNITSSAVQLSDVATLSRLASTAAGDGASLIGVEAIANMTASNVQAALAELQAEFDALGSGTLTDLQTEIDAIENSIGAMVDANGAYVQTSGSNYMDAATDITGAFNALDTNLKNVQDEVDSIETAMGTMIDANGDYSAFSGSNYMDSAANVTSALSALDGALKTASDNASAGQAEIDAIENAMGAMVDANGDFVTITGSNYMGSAVDVLDAMKALDTQLNTISNNAGAIVDYDNLGMGDGTTTLYTATAGAFVAGSLKVYVNGLLMSKGSGAEQVQETAPASGTFTFGTAPATDDEIIISHR